MDANTRNLHPAPDSHPSTHEMRRADGPAEPAGQSPGQSVTAGEATRPDPRLVFAKTLAGNQAVRTPGQRVSLAARRLLMLFDGQRSLAQLPHIVRPDEVPTLLQELEAHGLITLAGRLSEDLATASIHPDLKMAQIKRSLAGVFERELGDQASVLEARVQDCVNLVVLRNVLREVITLVAQRKDDAAADRIALIVKTHGPF